MPRSKDGRWTVTCARPGCGKTFTQRKPGQEYCSQACSNKAFPGTGGRKPAQGLDPRECVVCLAVFQPYRDGQVTCSRLCYRRQPEVREAANAHKRLPSVRDIKNERRRTVPEQVQRVRETNFRNNLRKYGLTVEEFEARLAAQGGVCIICGKPPKPDGIRAASRLHVDHDHVTGQNRDLICNNCNRGVGYFKDDPALMRAAAEYIERHRALTATPST